MMFTKKEQKILSVLLGKTSGPDAVRTLEGLHGFLFGLAVMPEPVLPSEWLPAVFGEEKIEIDSERQGEELVGQLFSAYNRINLLDEQNQLAFPFSPDNQKDEEVQKIREWAKGLFRAISLRPGVWGMSDGEVDADDLSENEQAVLSSIGFIWAWRFRSVPREYYPRFSIRPTRLIIPRSYPLCTPPSLTPSRLSESTATG